MLDIIGCELIWIGSSDDIEHNLGEIGRELEEEADADVTVKEVMKDIHLNEDEHPTQPLVDGQWPKAEDAPEKQDKKDDNDDAETKTDE